MLKKPYFMNNTKWYKYDDNKFKLVLTEEGKKTKSKK